MALSLTQLNAALGELSRQGIWRHGNRQQAFQELTQTAVRLLDVARCSIWLYDSNRSQIVCADLFVRETGSHTCGAVIERTACPAYFEALEAVRNIAANDAFDDPRTREFAAGYLDVLGITSMLDTPIVVQGACIGVVCLEHVGVARWWTDVEQTFAGSVGDFAALAVEAAELSSAQRALKRQEQSLRLAMHDLEMVLHAASHELRSPIVQIAGFCGELSLDLRETLKAARRGDIRSMERLATGPVREALHFIETGAQQMAHTLDGLLRVSEAGQADERLQTVDMNRVVAEAVRTVEPLLVEAQGTITVGSLPACYGDRAQLLRVLIKVLRNAVQYRCPSRPLKVWISGRIVDATSARYEVGDTGLGVAPEYRSRVFDTFDRLAPEASEGRGIGLSIARRIVLSHGGRIWLDSHGAPGALLCFVLPRGPES